MSKIVYSGHRTVPLRWVLAGAVGAALLVLIVGLSVGLTRPACPGPATPAPTPDFTASVPTQGPTPTTTPDPKKPWLFMRLPKYQIPTHYRVRLHPRLGAESNQGFIGEVDIDMKLTQPTKYILVHVKYLSVTSTNIFKNNGTEPLPVASGFNYTENQFWVIEMQSEVPGDTEVVVKLKFRGYYFGIVGLYQSTYKENGVEKYLATTKFEPTDARKAFPCLDEPNLKAVFTVELIHHKNYSALSNMPAKDTQNIDDNLRMTTFIPTPKMSTYLFCILISQFSGRNSTQPGNPFSVWAAPSYIGQAEYALTSGKTIQDYFGNWLNYSYDAMFPKQDMAAIPDFPSGAMEHWGLITYRDTAMLFDNAQGSASNKQGVLRIVAHELAHMWFGNLVTMVWWNDLWLNEGFASYFADIGSSEIEKNWALREQGIVSTYNSAFNADDVITSHPIIVDVATPQEITQIFDTITYSKGQAVLTQLENFVGMEVLQKGLARYLKANEYDVASAKQLYESLQFFSSQNVTEFMERWTLQMGFPLVTVSEGSSSEEIVVNQTWFLRDPSTRSQAPASPFGYQWVIKLNFNAPNKSSASEIMRDTTMTLRVPGYAGMRPPLKMNFGQMGFYRVNYPASWWEGIANALKTNADAYPPVDRAGLIGDAFAIAQSNQLSYAAVVKLLGYLQGERSYLAWVTANSGLNTITRQLARRASFGKWSTFGRKITNEVYTSIGWNSTSEHLDKLLQPIVLNLACRFGNSACITRAKSLFMEWMNGSSIDAEFRQIVYTYGLMESDTQETWDFVWNKYLESNFAAEKERLLRALAMTKNSWLINQLLEYSLDRTKVRSQDFVTLIGYIGANPNALEILWSWCRDKWPLLLKEFGPEDRRLGAMIPGFASQFNDEFHLREYKAFIGSTEPGAGANARQTTLQVIQANIQWLSANEHELIAAVN